MKKKNLLEYHNRPFVVTYEFDTTRLFIEPIYLLFALAGVFTLGIIIGRAKFDFVSNPSEVAHVKTD